MATPPSPGFSTWICMDQECELYFRPLAVTKDRRVPPCKRCGSSLRRQPGISDDDVQRITEAVYNNNAKFKIMNENVGAIRNHLRHLGDRTWKHEKGFARIQESRREPATPAVSLWRRILIRTQEYHTRRIRAAARKVTSILLRYQQGVNGRMST